MKACRLGLYAAAWKASQGRVSSFWTVFLFISCRIAILPSPTPLSIPFTVLCSGVSLLAFPLICEPFDGLDAMF